MIHTFDCYFSENQGAALDVFNGNRQGLEQMHGAKIKIIRMYKKFLSNYKVDYVLVEN